MKFKQNYVQIVDSVDSWESAIRLVAEPLILDKVITENYREQMIRNVEKLGPYIVISQDVAIPHARPEDGAFESAISILKLKERISFGNDKKVNTIIALASSNDDDHIETLKFISITLSDKERYERLIQSEDAEAIYELMRKGV